MKKLFIIFLLAPMISGAQTTGQKIQDGIDAANDLADILNGNDPQANYNSWKSYTVTKYPDYICMMNFAFYKRNFEKFCFFVPSMRTVFIYWAKDNKKYRIPVLIDDTCKTCKIKGTLLYNDLVTKALDYTDYSNALDAYRNYIPFLLFNKNYIDWLTKLTAIPISKPLNTNQSNPNNTIPVKSKQ